MIAGEAFTGIAGPPLMMRAVSDLTKPYGVRTVAGLNSIMVEHVRRLQWCR